MSANREYKSTVFTKLFSEPETLIELYNALSGSNYSTDTKIEINTLEDVLFTDRRNDVSFTIDGKYVLLLEHQSTINANMPLRLLLYIARVYEKITVERAIYHEKLIEIPTPEFIVLYNGIKPFPAEKTLKLSNAYKGKDTSEEIFGNLELTVRVLNINPGHNDDLLQKSKTLYGYTAFMERIRKSQSKGLNLHEAIKDAVNWGMTKNILGAFLTEHGAEVSNMIQGQKFDIDIAKEVWQEEAREEGIEEGLEAGRQEERRDIARKLKASAIAPIEQIAEITGFTVAEIENM